MHPKTAVQAEEEETNVIPIHKVQANLGAVDGDWLTPMENDTHFLCTYHSPQIQLDHYKKLWMSNGFVYLKEYAHWTEARHFFVVPIEFCRKNEFKGVIKFEDE